MKRLVGIFTAIIYLSSIQAQQVLLEKIGLEGLCNGAISVVDFNNDGYMDIIFSGKKGAATDASNATYVYKGNGDGSFTLMSEPPTVIPEEYHNPVSEKLLPDPTIIRKGNGLFYLYATETSSRNMPIMVSKNLVDWSLVNTVFTNSTRPSFLSGGDLWAPDINYINGQYVLYYSLSKWGEEQANGIGVATAPEPDEKFSDKGKLFTSNEIGVQNSIDPCYVEDEGKKYLFWGSFRGIYAIELSEDGLSVKQGAEKRQIAGTYFEGVYVHKRNNYYYLFASIGSCCEGLNSTYQLVVGRSTSLFGPYVNKSGNSMMNNAYTLLINKNPSFVGNGHCSGIVQDDAGKDWILYHGIKTSEGVSKGRMLMLDQVKWDNNNWPYVEGGAPSSTSSMPSFNN